MQVPWFWGVCFKNLSRNAVNVYFQGAIQEPLKLIHFKGGRNLLAENHHFEPP